MHTADKGNRSYYRNNTQEIQSGHTKWGKKKNQVSLQKTNSTTIES